MPEEYTFLLYKSYTRESRTDFPGSVNEKIVGIPVIREREIPGMKETLLNTCRKRSSGTRFASPTRSTAWPRPRSSRSEITFKSQTCTFTQFN
jgi:hypothetical protein